MVHVKPLACKSLAREDATMPFPSELVTPPVTKMYFDFLGFPLPDITIFFIWLRETKIANKTHTELILFLFYLA
jgi:hypothetical protein